MRTKSAALLATVVLLFSGIIGVPLAGAAETAALSVQVTTDTDGSAELGRDCTYTITVRNAGSLEVVDLSVDDTFLGHVGEVGSLPAGESLQFTKTIAMRNPGSGVCTVTARDPQGEQVVASAEHSVEIFIGDAFTDLAVSKSMISGAATPGGTLRYQVVISNLGKDPVDVDALTCSVVDDFDQNRTTVLDAGAGTISAGQLLWTIDVPGPGESTVIEYTLRVRSDADGTIINTVSVEYPLDLDEANDRASVRTAIARPATTSDDEGPDGSGTRTDTGGRGPVASASSDEPFLPFTGTEQSRAYELALSFLLLGFALRMAARDGRLS